MESHVEILRISRIALGPPGSILGIYGLWVLSYKQTKRLCLSPPAAP